MKTNLITMFTGVAAIVLSCAASFNAAAQKLPSVQTAGILAPANIKIDGKATEWDDKFQAYNNHVEFYYTLSNDGTNLYLTVQAIERDIIRRIMNGGVTISVNKTGKKSDKDGLGITFPVFESNNRFSFRTNGTVTAGVQNAAATRDISVGAGGGSGGASFIAANSSPVAIGASLVRGAPVAALSPAQADSLMKVNNTNFNNKAKNIGLKGFKDLDSLISVYNEDGIKAAGFFDARGVYTYEMAIPLKYLGLDAVTASKFSYHILINAVTQKGIDIVNSEIPGGTQKMFSVKFGAGAQLAQDATDFWGEYTLAKK